MTKNTDIITMELAEISMKNDLEKYIQKFITIFELEREDYIYDMDLAQIAYEISTEIEQKSLDITQIFNSMQVEELIHFAELLAQSPDKELNKKAWRFVDVFKNVEFNENREYLNQQDQDVRNEKPFSDSPITTPQAHLAWLVQELVVKSEREDTNFLVRGLEITVEKLSSLNNYYLISQWLIPLIEITRRRLWLLESDMESYKSLRNLFFGTNNLIEKFSDNNTLGGLLIRSLNYMRELGTKDANYILEELDSAPEYEALLIYYACFRANHYKLDIGKKDQKQRVKLLNDSGFSTDYIPDLASSKLNAITRDESEESARIQGKIAWHFYRVLKEESPEIYPNIRPYVDNLSNVGLFKKELHMNLKMMLLEFPSQNFCEDYVDLLEKLINIFTNKLRQAMREDDYQNYYLAHWFKKDEYLNKLRKCANSEKYDEIVTKFNEMENLVRN